MEKDYQEIDNCDSVSESSLTNSFTPNTELNEGNTYPSEEAFIIAVKTYAKQQGFQVHLGKSEKNVAGQIHKRTIVCSKKGFSNKTYG